MNKDFAEWLASEPMPMFDIRWHKEFWDCASSSWLGPCYEVIQDAPRRTVIFAVALDALLPAMQKEFRWAKSAVGELAIKRAIADLSLEPWWGTAGSMTQELRFLVREGFKRLPAFTRIPVLRNQQAAQLMRH